MIEWMAQLDQLFWLGSCLGAAASGLFFWRRRRSWRARVPAPDESPDRPFVADYTHWWTPPQPLVPQCSHCAALVVLAVVYLLALCLAVLAVERAG